LIWFVENELDQNTIVIVGATEQLYHVTNSRIHLDPAV